MFEPVVIPGGQPRRAKPLLRTMLGDVLRRIRREQGRTLADVATAARVSMPYLSELERGLKEASSEVLAAICDALGIELSDLLAEVGADLTGSPARRAQIVRLGGASEIAPAGERPEDGGLGGSEVVDLANGFDGSDVLDLAGDLGDPRPLRPSDVTCRLAA